MLCIPFLLIQLIDVFGYTKDEVTAYSEELEKDKDALLKLYKAIVMGELSSVGSSVNPVRNEMSFLHM